MSIETRRLNPEARVLASVLAGKEVGGLPRGESGDRGGSLAFGLEGCRIQEYRGEAPVLVKGLGPEDYDLLVAAPGMRCSLAPWTERRSITF